MITLKEMLAEPQTMYDGGMVQHMSEGGEPESNLPVPTEEEESLVGDIVGYASKVGKKVGKKAVDIATKRVPGIGLISSSPVADATIPGFMTKILEEKRNKAFGDLAWEQRGNPEAAMLELQKAIGGGVLGNVAEHVGDLTHRMSEKFEYLKGSSTSVASKIKSTLRTLRSDYGFEKEYLENIKNNAEFHNIPVEELLNKGNEKLAEYANEHRKLKVYNEPQKWARDAAVAIGEKNWNRAITELEKLEDLIKNPDAYEEAVSKFDEDFWDVSHIIERPSSSTVTEPQLPVTTKPTLPVPKSLERSLPKVIGTAVKALSRRLPAVQIAAQVLDLIPPKTKDAAIDYLKNTPTHELFGFKQSGQEYVEDLWKEVKNNLTTETDEASRIARAEEQGFTQQFFHGTRGDFLEFNTSDLGVHVGTQEQANIRLANTRSTHGMEGENVIPTWVRMENPLELPDVGSWNDPVVVIDGILNIRGNFKRYPVSSQTKAWINKHDEALLEIISAAEDMRDMYEDHDAWRESDDAKGLLDEIRDLIKEDGYDSVKYRNEAENKYGDRGGLTVKGQREFERLNEEYHELRRKKSTRKEQIKYKQTGKNLIPPLSVEETKRFTSIPEEKEKLLEEETYSPYSYIILDTKNIRSPHAQFDPTKIESSNILNADGGQIRPMYDGGIVPSSTKPMYDGGLV